jgi:hypothetical protein
MNNELQKYIDHRSMIDAIVDRLPDNVLKNSLSYVPRGQVFTILTSCRAFYNVAKAALYSHLALENRNRVDRLMICYPDPDEIAGYVEILEIPGALSSPAQEYINRLVQRAHNLHRLRVGVVDSTDTEIPYMPTIPKNHQISTLIVGEKACNPITADVRMISLTELQPFPNLTNLAWFPVDPRIGSIQYILTTIYQMCPDIVYLQVPWSDHISTVPWEDLPHFHSLRQITVRFEHQSLIDLTEFVKCLYVFYSRNIKVRIGSGCAMETVKWLQELYVKIHVHETSHGRMPSEMLSRVFQDNRGHLINLRDIPPTTFVTVSNDGSSPTVESVSGDRLKESLYEAVDAVDYSDGDGLRVEMDLTSERQLPNILLSKKLVYARLLVTRHNVPPQYIPEILRSNPKLTSLVVAKHVQHHGSTYDGNCTYNKVPLLPQQDRCRTSVNGQDKYGVQQRYTVPSFELLFRLRRQDDGNITKQWKAYTPLRRGRPAPLATELPKLNVFGLQNPVEEEWPDRLLNRLKAWEDEIKSWFDLCPKLTTIAVVLNTDSQKFGKIEKYWCSCNEYDYL